MLSAPSIGSCAACGIELGGKGTAYRLSQVSGSGHSAGITESFFACSWCVDQMRTRGAVLRANERRARTPNQRHEQMLRAKASPPPWLQRRQLGRSQR
jgi:hypothetical protein